MSISILDLRTPATPFTDFGEPAPEPGEPVLLYYDVPAPVRLLYKVPVPVTRTYGVPGPVALHYDEDGDT